MHPISPAEDEALRLPDKTGCLRTQIDVIDGGLKLELTDYIKNLQSNEVVPED